MYQNSSNDKIQLTSYVNGLCIVSDDYVNKRTINGISFGLGFVFLLGILLSCICYPTPCLNVGVGKTYGQAYLYNVSYKFAFGRSPPKYV